MHLTMKDRVLVPSLLLSLVASSASMAAHTRAKIVYGTDDRVQVSESSPLYQTMARATSAMIPWNAIRTISLGGLPHYEVSGGDTLASSMNLCPGERFANEPNPAMCTGFLIAPDLLVTAGHCIESKKDCRDNAWVFDFEMISSDKARLSFNNKQVYRCTEVVRTTKTDELDFAIVRLDRAVESDRTPYTLRSQGTIQVSDHVTVIGHPSGLPKKVSANAAVRDSSNPYYFTTNLDTFGGNSGSPVVNTETHELEGILVRGDKDYIKDEALQCNRVNVVSESIGSEAVTKILAIPDLATVLNGTYSIQDVPEEVVQPIDSSLVQLYFTMAVITGDADMLTRTIGLGAEINTIDQYGKYPIHWATMLGKADIVTILLEAGADVTVRDSDGATAFDGAILFHNTDILKALLWKSKVDVPADLVLAYIAAMSDGSHDWAKLLFVEYAKAKGYSIP